MDSQHRRHDSDRGHGGYGGHGGGYGGHGGPPRRRGVPLSDLDPALTDISRRVIGCAIEVHKELGPGYNEEVYTNALKHELDHEGIKYRQNHPFDVYYDDVKVGAAVADLYINDRFIVDVMAFHGEIGSGPRATVRAQLRAADQELALIINFGERRLKDGLVRVLNPDKIESLNRDDAEDDEAEEESEGNEA